MLGIIKKNTTMRNKSTTISLSLLIIVPITIVAAIYLYHFINDSDAGRVVEKQNSSTYEQEEGKLKGNMDNAKQRINNIKLYQESYDESNYPVFDITLSSENSTIQKMSDTFYTLINDNFTLDLFTQPDGSGGPFYQLPEVTKIRNPAILQQIYRIKSSSELYYYTTYYNEVTASMPNVCSSFGEDIVACGAEGIDINNSESIIYTTCKPYNPEGLIQCDEIIKTMEVKPIAD